MLLDKKLLGLVKIASNDQGRPVLNGILLSASRAIATDSFRLLEIDLHSEPDIDLPDVGMPKIEDVGEKHLLPAVEFGKALSAIPVKPLISVLGYAWTSTGHEGTVKIVSTNLTSITAPDIKEVAGDYPDTHKEFPTSEVKATTILDIKLLSGLLDAISKAGIEKIKIEIRGLSEPVVLLGEIPDGNKRVENPNGTHTFEKIIRKVRGLIMPLRI